MSHRHVILGTAGHIDHGKTALVKALTGVDTDRLKEEKARGLTIDLGFAHLGDQTTIIDVPGHEKFIKNMVAGVSTIDLVLFVVAADDGVMPQTREHFDILNLLQVKSGIIVITKKDLVDDDWLELVKEDVRQLVRGSFLESAPIIAVSSVTGENMDVLKRMIREHVAQLPPRPDRGIFWMPVDRSFVMKGFGTVVTGSVLSGSLRTGDEVEQLPQGRRLRVRGLQKHGKPVEQVQVGDRAAINLQGIAREDIERGHVLASPGYFSATRHLQGKLRLLPGARPLASNTRIRLHLGTAEIIARVRPIGVRTIEPGQEAYVHFSLEKDAAARRLDPFVIRQYSPPHTIGGGVILDANPPPYRRKDPTLLERLQRLEKEDPEELVREQLFAAAAGLMTEEQLASRTGMARETVRDILRQLRERDEIVAIGKKNVAHRRRLEQALQTLCHRLAEFHRQHPTRIGLRKAELGHLLSADLSPLLLDTLIETGKARGQLREDGGYIALTEHEIRLSPEQQQLKDSLARLLQEQAFTPESPEALAARLNASAGEVETLLEVLVLEGQVVRLDEGIFMHRDRVQQAEHALIAHLKQHGQITVPEFKELIQGASRKYAIPLLNYFDAREITLREGDVRYPGAALDF